MSTASHALNFNDKLRYVNRNSRSEFQLSIELRQLGVMLETSIINWDMLTASDVPNFNHKLRYVNRKSPSKPQLKVELLQLRLMFKLQL